MTSFLTMRRLFIAFALFALAAASARAQLDCTLRIFQGEAEISPTPAGKTNAYPLAAKPFRIEVAPPDCTPTMALVTPHRLDYILQTPLVFSPSGVFMAGDPKEADILANLGGDNPRTTLAEILAGTSEPAWAKQQFEELCGTLGYCPTPTLAFSTAWPFLDPATTEFRGYADFRRFSKFEPMSGASGRVLLAVVYTRWKTLTKGSGFSQSVFHVLRPNALIFDFR